MLSQLAALSIKPRQRSNMLSCQICAMRHKRSGAGDVAEKPATRRRHLATSQAHRVRAGVSPSRRQRLCNISDFAGVKVLAMPAQARRRRCGGVSASVRPCPKRRPVAGIVTSSAADGRHCQTVSTRALNAGFPTSATTTPNISTPTAAHPLSEVQQLENLI
jgi:hypothetical protein